MTNEQYHDLIQPYESAGQMMRTRLDTLNKNLYCKTTVSPIHNILYRTKSKRSIEKKLEKMGHSDSVQNAKDYLKDIEGIRVICYFIDDIYNLVNALRRQSELIVIKEKDYIKNPKKSGYQSLHLILEVPVTLQEETQWMKVELQLRTAAMDYWANLDHELRYKKTEKEIGEVDEALRQCADVIRTLDLRMLEIRKKIASM